MTPYTSGPYETKLDRLDALLDEMRTYHYRRMVFLPHDQPDPKLVEILRRHLPTQIKDRI